MFAANMDYIYFVYGLSFVLLAMRASAFDGRDAVLPWRLIAAFGWLHGLNEWLDLSALSLGDTPTFKIIRLAVMLVSFLPLIEFGRRGLIRQGVTLLGVWIYLPLSAFIALVAWSEIGSLNAAGRYALALPGGLLSGCALWRVAHPMEEGRQRSGLRSAAVAMAIYGVAAGLVVPRAALFPASWLNHDAFFTTTGMPIQFIRALCATGTLAGLWWYGQPSESKRPTYWERFVGWRYPMMVALMVALGWIATAWRGHGADAEMRERLLRQAVEIAQNLPLEQVRALSFTAADRGTPAFERLRELMIAYARFVRQPSLYSMALRNGVILFGPENLAEDDPLASPPGTVYQQPEPEVFEIFKIGLPFTMEPHQDEYGEFVSAIAPVVDPHNGRVLIAIGLDIRTNDWNAQVAISRLTPIVGTLLLLTILLSSAAAIEWRNRQLASRWPRSRHIETTLVGVLGLALTIAITLLVLETENRERGVLFHRLADARAGNIRNTLDDIQANLSALAQLYRINPQVNRDEFSAFAKPMARMTPIQAYEWIPRLTAVDKTRFEIDAQRNGLDGFFIWERNAQGEPVPVTDRADYYPVYGIEPPAGNRAALGFDLGSDPTRRAAMEAALRTGLITTTHPVALVQDPDRQPAMLAFQPVFASSAEAAPERTDADAAGRLRGFVLGVLQLQILLDRALLRGIHDPDEVAVDLVDLMVADGPTLLAAHPRDYESGHIEAITSARFEQRGFQAIHPLFALGRAQAVVIRPTPLFHATHPARAGWLAATAGVLVTALLTAFVGFLRNRQAALEQQIQIRTAALQDSEEQFRSYYELGLIGMAIISPTKHWVQFNDRLCRTLGYSREELAAKTWDEIIHPTDRAASVNQFNRVLDGEIDGFALDKRFIHRNGNVVHAVLSMRCMRDADGAMRYFVAMIQDITERKTLELELRRLATTDSLTDLANRRCFLAQVTQELARFKRYAKPAALMMVDLDHFKRVNDTYGHAAGDAVLRHFAVVIRQVLRKIDMSGRLGGEEFAALLPGTDCEGAQRLAERLRRIMAESPIYTAGDTIKVTVSIGVTPLARPDADADAILGRADRALYRAKEQGRNRVEIETPDDVETPPPTL